MKYDKIHTMYIRLTKLDNTPIWLNAAFIVTIEPRRGGGSIVVPIGDGLDYDVKESVEAVLGLLEGAPVAAVVPVPPPPGLAPTNVEALPAPTADEKTPAASETAETKDDTAEAPKKAAKAKKATAAKKPRTTRRSPKAVMPDLTDEQIERLRKMAPRSIRKLQNTLDSQFGVADAEATVKALVAKGILSVDNDHIVWAAVREALPAAESEAVKPAETAEPAPVEAKDEKPAEDAAE